MKSLSRRSFLKTAGAATGAAAISASPAVAAAMGPSTVETAPSVPLPHEPVVAIVRDARLGEVTLLSGTTEKTYRDPLLVKRLMKIAQRQGRGHKEEGVA
jgi:hypothetical protein